MLKLSTYIISAILIFASIKYYNNIANHYDLKTSWWKTAIIYQIFIRSFKDSNADGIGDIQGIISKLDYFKEAGITVIWLTPIFTSPQIDSGYDVSDFTNIHEEYGTLKDFEELLDKANKLGLKVLLDLIPNHTSEEHEWFVKSENRVLGYEDYYVWIDGDAETPPNNWRSVFKFSAWKFSKKRGQWYLHQFAKEQPDLNLSNSKVIEEFKEIIKFWFDKGVHGLRVDAVPYLFESKGLEDEPPSGDLKATPDDHEFLLHIYTKDQPETYELLYDLRDFVDEYNNHIPEEEKKVLLSEAYTTVKNTMLIYGNGNRLGAHFTFNLNLTLETNSSNAKDIVSEIQRWLIYMPRDCIANWMVGNHDVRRVATRLGKGNVDGYNMLMAMLPGVSVTYNGEEIGMENSYVSLEYAQDPRVIVSPEVLNKTGRDGARTPFHWDDSKHAGFTDGNSTWLPVSPTYVTNNLKQQLGIKNSHFRIFQKMNTLRKEVNELKYGRTEIQAYSDYVIVLRRYLYYGKNYILVFNIGDYQEVVDLSDVFDLKYYLEVIVGTNLNRKYITRNKFLLYPHESFIAVEMY